MTSNLPESVDVETGRLNLALQEILTELQVRTSRESHPSDTVIRINRTQEGVMTCRRDPAGALLEPDPRLASLSLMIVAGINVVGNVAVRVRMENSEAVFVSVWTEP